MFHLATKEQWQSLFKISDQIKNNTPWKRFRNNEIIAVYKDGTDEPIFYSILGEENDHCGVSVYFGYQALAGFFQLLQFGSEIPFSALIAYQNCLTVYYSSRASLGNGDLSSIELAEYQPQVGPLGYPFFRSYIPGYAPWYLEPSEVDRLTGALNDLYTGLQLLEKKAVDANYKNQECLCFHQLSDGSWEVLAEKLPVFSVEYQTLQFEDELFIARLKKLPKTARSIEVDINYLPNPLTAKYGFRPIFPRICILADHDGGFIENQQVLEEQQDHHKVLIEMLLESIRENGRPRLIIIRSGTLRYLLEDLCKKTGIQLEERTNLEIIDDFMGLLGNFPPIN